MYSVNFALGGQTSAYRFLTVFNLSDSTRSLVLRKVSVIGYAGALSLSTVPLVLSRITTATSGSPQNASVVNKFVTSYPAPVAEVRITNPTVTLGPKIFSFAPPLQGLTAGALSPTPQVVGFAGSDLVLGPGEGFAFHQESAGLTAQQYNIYASWMEAPL